jgi:hypothetical protein
MRLNFVAFSLATMLCGCGTPYVQPAPTAPAAEIILPTKNAVDHRFSIVNFDEKGCYSGGSAVPPAKVDGTRVIGYRVVPDVRLVMAYSGSIAGSGFSSKSCGFAFSFTPKSDAKYTLITDEIKDMPNPATSKFVRFFAPSTVDYCMVGVIEETAEGAVSTVSLHKTGPRQASFACIRFP